MRSTVQGGNGFQMSNANFEKTADGVFKVPVRETWYSQNIKEDGVAYCDPKTKARRFQMNTFSSSFNPHRQVHQSAGDAIVDPTITIRHENAMPRPKFDYQELNKRGTFDHDVTTRVIHDYTGATIIKVD